MKDRREEYDSIKPLETEPLEIPPEPKPTTAVAIAVGPSPPSNRESLPAIPGSTDTEAQSISFESAGLRKILYEKALALLESPSHKIQASIWHDLMEAQGLIGKKGELGDFGKAASQPPSKSLNLIFNNDPGKAAALLQAFGEVAKGMGIELPTEPQ